MNTSRAVGPVLLMFVLGVGGASEAAAQARRAPGEATDRESTGRVAVPRTSMGASAPAPVSRPQPAPVVRSAPEISAAPSSPAVARYSLSGAGQSDSSGRSRVPPATSSGGGGGGHRSGGGGSSAGSSSSGGSSSGRTAVSGGSGSRSGGASGGSYGTAQPRQRYPNRNADGSYAAGHAVPRGSYPTHPIYRPPYHPWYGSWYPWGFGSYGLGFYFWDPYWYGGPYQYGYGYVGGGDYEECGVRLLVKPRDAQVYVDGFYVGVVDEFDGIFQVLRVSEGPHRIEIRKEGFETLVFDIRATYDHTLKIRGELQPSSEP